jgi:hypothetical protein
MLFDEVSTQQILFIQRFSNPIVLATLEHHAIVAQKVTCRATFSVITGVTLT